MDKSFLNCVVASICCSRFSLQTPCTMYGSLSSCNTHKSAQAHTSQGVIQHALTFCAAEPPPRLESSIAPPTPDAGKTARFFCKFSSRLSFLSWTILSSLFLRASSASMPFLKSFFLRSFLLEGLATFIVAGLRRWLRFSGGSKGGKRLPKPAVNTR